MENTTQTQQYQVGQAIEVAFPALNKNNTLEENDRRIAENTHSEKCRVCRVIELDAEEYANIGNSLLDDCGLWSKIGGSTLYGAAEKEFDKMCEDHGVQEDPYKWMTIPELREYFKLHSVTNVVVVLCAGKEPFFVNTEGYEYARYVGRQYQQQNNQ